MPDTIKQTQVIQHLVEPTIIISASNPVSRIARICWNTGEEKNCVGCYLGKSCKAIA